jgi:hypothetical protein
MNQMPDDMSSFANEIQKMAQTGGFNPFAMLAGDSHFHSLFLAPFSPSLREHIARFLHDGSGPLADVAKSLEQQGASPAQAMQQAREMFQAAQGMLVIVMASDHGVSTIPQLNYGHMEPGYCEHALRACGEQFSAKDEVAKSLQTLAEKTKLSQAQRVQWPAFVAGPGFDKTLKNYWLELADMIVDGMDDGMLSLTGGGIERLRDLAHWVASAVHDAQFALDEEETVAVARCHLLANQPEAAAARLDQLVHADADADALAELVIHVSDAAIRTSMPIPAAQWLAQFTPRFESLFGTCYELRVARVKLLAAAGVNADELLPAVRDLVAANKKSARQDLTREPIWRVVVNPGELLDTNAAATHINRSTAFIAKRLEQGTIPFHREQQTGQPDQIRLPKQALSAWIAAMNEFKFLD